MFLDEVANLSLSSQAKLLTVLERRQVTPLGADQPVAVDVRIVSATNLDESSLFDAQRFRSDLLYRLNTVVLRVPPLRERRDDIGLLVRHYLAHYAMQYARPVREVTPEALDRLENHGWHGNVRALRHACERAVILATGDRLEALDFSLQEPTPGAFNDPGVVVQDSNRAVDTLPAPQAVTEIVALSERERGALQEAMQATKGNVSHAAKLLGLSRAALYRRLEKYGL